MAEQVALSEYIQEIQARIQDHRAAEALALCKHILRQFPKHLETYSLMAHALVESLDTNGALDIYRRVLSADPENVDAYIGTARILDARSHLDEALWHMERAFELAPTRADTRKELLDLYTHAEGNPRGRLKLTRAALARLYVQEGLLPQAIRELREISQETPSRYDVRVALAEALWRAEQTRQAAQVAQSLLDPLPYCLKANLILGTAWRESAIEESDSFLQRAQALDPSNQVANQLLGDRSPLSPVQITITRYEGEELFPSRREGEKKIPETRERMEIETTIFEIPPLVAPKEVEPESAESTEGAPPKETADKVITQESFSTPEEPVEADESKTSFEGLPDWLSDLRKTFAEHPEASAPTGAENYLGEQPTKAELASDSAEETSPSEAEQEDESMASLQTTALPSEAPSSSEEELTPEETAQEGEAATAHEEAVPTWLSDAPEETITKDKRLEEEEMPSWLEGAQAEASSSPKHATPEIKMPKWVEVLSRPPRDAASAAGKETRPTEPVAPAAPEATPPQDNQPESEYNSRLAQARQHRDANQWSDAFADYDFVINKAPKLLGDVIADLESLVASGDPPLEAQRVLGDAYSRAGRLDDALESYRLLYRHLSELD